MIDRPIGSTFRLEVKPFMDVTLKVEPDATVEICERCFLKNINCGAEPFHSQIGACAAHFRMDNTHIHFVKVTNSDHDC